MTTTASTSLALLTLVACGGGSSPAPTTPTPTPTAKANAAGRPTTREALADVVYTAFERNQPGDLDALLPTEAEILAACPEAARTNMKFGDQIARWHEGLAETIKACQADIVWTSARRTALWGGHPSPPETYCPGLAQHTTLDIDLETSKGPVTLRIGHPQQVADGFVMTFVECGSRQGSDEELAALGIDETEQGFEGYVNEVCACKDMKCITDAGQGYADRHKDDKRPRHTRPSKRMVELTAKMADCNKTVMEEEMRKAQPPESDDDDY